MTVMAQVNPITGDNFYALSTKSLANNMLHPDNFYNTETEAYEGEKELAEYMLAYVAEQDADRGKGRRPLILGEWEHEANTMLSEYAQFMFGSNNQ